MIYITGDTHGTIDFNKIYNLKHRNLLGINDYIIIAGDFGGVWNKNTLNQSLKAYTKLPCMVLFVDGNHENFELLNSFPVSEWKGGKVHIIRNNIIHLMRGQIFTIEGHTFFAFGGGTSIDRIYRTEHISWWKEEIPNEQEIEEAKINLKKYNNKVDYIITHSIDEKALSTPGFTFYGQTFEPFKDNLILNWFEENVKYKKWFFGHYHLDFKISDKKVCLYNSIEAI